MRAWLGFVVLFCALGAPALGLTVEEVPRPPKGSWTVDLTSTRVLQPSVQAELEQMGTELDDRGLGQLMVVMLDTTSSRPSREFALALFNRWGIGHPGRDDGVLLFVAYADRKVEIILGDGVDEPADQEASDAVMAQAIVPGFKRNDPNAAVQLGARGLRELIENSRLNHPNDAAPESVASNAFVDSLSAEEVQAPPPQVTWIPPEETSTEPGLGVFAGGAGMLGAAGLAGRAWLRRRPRKCKACGTQRLRLGEVEDDAHLEAGQRAEESLGSVDYDVWWCEPCADVLIERYGALFTFVARCTKCNYVTGKQSTRTLRSATYDHGGEEEVTVRCGHCAFVSVSRRSTPRRTRPSSSSSSSSSRSSSGGGRSSGGGSSGSW
ncbi:TPM domain-containing protein [Corallococcus sp. BB11-1]|uniref:TPM domain-containing protein n=1 Tax=Corallococcus sp. BB11-1 TaxID=2996783 RepID=UPI0010F33A46|nr:TPM domain-containing protein [Corallococcus sp. BB11-1]MCY1032726.1 TPM domain-containing protein [Corallococcus sp. BB11-1]RYZ46586.1 MAG: TPM domain-containing protein [Myxococcaceae bacterium]